MSLIERLGLPLQTVHDRAEPLGWQAIEERLNGAYVMALATIPAEVPHPPSGELMWASIAFAAGIALLAKGLHQAYQIERRGAPEEKYWIYSTFYAVFAVTAAGVGVGILRGLG